jgi:hypothetical protein
MNTAQQSKEEKDSIRITRVPQITVISGVRLKRKRHVEKSATIEAEGEARKGEWISTKISGVTKESRQ